PPHGKDRAAAPGRKGPGPASAAPPATQRPPIELEAGQVTGIIKRGGTKDELHELIADGSVHVHQDPEKAEDKGVDIKGNLLNLVHHPKGDILYVFGEKEQLAQLQLGELHLTGPKVTINQQSNVAEVHGAGGMSLPSNTTFDGGKPTKTNTP